MLIRNLCFQYEINRNFCIRINKMSLIIYTFYLIYGIRIVIGILLHTNVYAKSFKLFCLDIYKCIYINMYKEI